MVFNYSQETIDKAPSLQEETGSLKAEKAEILRSHEMKNKIKTQHKKIIEWRKFFMTLISQK